MLRVPSTQGDSSEGSVQREVNTGIKLSARAEGEVFPLSASPGQRVATTSIDEEGSNASPTPKGVSSEHS